ncbi:hypothetical protein [uncultured Algibacter sp.]|uniref:hypothetical protein n=1 Tax=uncultured Algibacter sp. TaxID=298659 RepID=UPI002639E9A0|nr:hypothetical protein [uncultured Algibacter sp.]
MRNLILIVVTVVFFQISFSQIRGYDINIQTFTPSKLLSKGQWDVTWDNNLYTQTDNTDEASSFPRENYFTSSIGAFTGMSRNDNWNFGLILEVQSSTIGGRGFLDVLQFSQSATSRAGITSFAPVVRFNPIVRKTNFTIQSALRFPFLDNEVEDGIFLSQTAFMFENRFLYDYTFSNENWQFFSELRTEYNFGDDDSFFNNTFVLEPIVYLSFFPAPDISLLGFIQYQRRFGGSENRFIALGGGAKYQISKVMNFEILFRDIVKGAYSQGLGYSLNFGLRALFL